MGSFEKMSTLDNSLSSVLQRAIEIGAMRSSFVRYQTITEGVFSFLKECRSNKTFDQIECQLRKNNSEMKNLFNGLRPTIDELHLIISELTKLGFLRRVTVIPQSTQAECTEAFCFNERYKMFQRPTVIRQECPQKYILAGATNIDIRRHQKITAGVLNFMKEEQCERTFEQLEKALTKKSSEMKKLFDGFRPTVAELHFVTSELTRIQYLSTKSMSPQNLPIPLVSQGRIPSHKAPCYVTTFQFNTNRDLGHLTQAQQWYVDGTTSTQTGGPGPSK